MQVCLIGCINLFPFVVLYFSTRVWVSYWFDVALLDFGVWWLFILFVFVCFCLLLMLSGLFGAALGGS